MILVTNLLVTQSKRYEDFIVLLGFLKLLKRVSKQLGFCTVHCQGREVLYESAFPPNPLLTPLKDVRAQKLPTHRFF